MNIAKIASLNLETPVDTSPIIREREGKLVKMIEAIDAISQSKEWTVLKEEVFDSLVTTLNKQISAEARKENPDTLKLNRLAGQLKWAEKYSDLRKLESLFRTELTNIREQLNGKK